MFALACNVDDSVINSSELRGEMGKVPKHVGRPESGSRQGWRRTAEDARSQEAVRDGGELRKTLEVRKPSGMALKCGRGALLSARSGGDETGRLPVGTSWKTTLEGKAGTMKRILAIAAACCALVMAFALAACGGSSSGSAASGSASAAGGDAKAGYTADGYLDEFGVITAKALIELDGAELSKVAKAADYAWDEKHAEWKKLGSEAAPSKGLTSEEMQASNGTDAFEFTESEVAGLAAGGKGTPIMWLTTSIAKIDSVEQVLANQQVKVVDQCVIEHRNYGKEIWAIVQNNAGERFLLCAQQYSDKSAVNLYTAEYIAASAHGIASHFNSYEYLLYDAHTIDAIWPILQSGQVS